jgi:hypothetical protein
MATIQGTYVQTGLGSTDRINAIVDVMLASSLVEFRQIVIYHERGTKIGQNAWRFSYQNWNPDYPYQVYLNNSPTALDSSLYSIDYTMGIINLTGTFTEGDNIQCTYCFDYFPIYVFEGFLVKAVDVINMGAHGPVTSYDLSNAPSNWDGVIADLVFAMCMEKLILDYDLWKGRLIFAIGPQALADGGGDILGALETLKQNAEDRAYRSMDNEMFKTSPHLAKPTKYYYESLLVGSSSRNSAHGIENSGKLRGWKITKYLGRILGWLIIII